jgi:hypothetical protein
MASTEHVSTIPRATIAPHMERARNTGTWEQIHSTFHTSAESVQLVPPPVNGLTADLESESISVI